MNNNHTKPLDAGVVLEGRQVVLTAHPQSLSILSDEVEHENSLGT